MTAIRSRYALTQRLRFLRLLSRELRYRLYIEDLSVPFGSVGITLAKLEKWLTAWVVPYRADAVGCRGPGVCHVLERAGLAPTQLRLLRRAERRHKNQNVVFVAYRPRFDPHRARATLRRSRRPGS